MLLSQGVIQLVLGGGICRVESYKTVSIIIK